MKNTADAKEWLKQQKKDLLEIRQILHQQNEQVKESQRFIKAHLNYLEVMLREAGNNSSEGASETVVKKNWWLNANSRHKDEPYAGFENSRQPLDPEDPT